jgi:hypothetical protein
MHLPTQGEDTAAERFRVQTFDRDSLFQQIIFLISGSHDEWLMMIRTGPAGPSECCLVRNVFARRIESVTGNTYA